MTYTPSIVAKNSLIVLLVSLLSQLVADPGPPNLVSIYRALIAAGLAGVLSYENNGNPPPIPTPQHTPYLNLLPMDVEHRVG